MNNYNDYFTIIMFLSFCEIKIFHSITNEFEIYSDE